ncbi:hypothetical protein ABT112_21430 [Streptomyces sp. NPDC002055]|uniref:hypothetical protein n=1 Tax=Streptomyces sp. NPDC002055 TaxID=3154534 RepID=UPI003333C5CD
MTSNWQRLFQAPRVPDPHSPGSYPYRGPGAEIPPDLDWASLDRLCPVEPLPDRYRSLLAPEVINEMRAELKRGLTPPFHGHWAIRLGRLWEDVVPAKCPEPTSRTAGRLYVLEFQGPHQYVLLGHTKDVSERVRCHIREAGRHGYGLLNAWASPVLPHAQEQEQMALHLAEDLHDARHVGERFYEMPFDTGLTVVRAAAEAGLLNAVPDAVDAEPA